MAHVMKCAKTCYFVSLRCPGLGILDTGQVISRMLPSMEKIQIRKLRSGDAVFLENSL